MICTASGVGDAGQGSFDSIFIAPSNAAPTQLSFHQSAKMSSQRPELSFTAHAKETIASLASPSSSASSGLSPAVDRMRALEGAAVGNASASSSPAITEFTPNRSYSSVVHSALDAVAHAQTSWASRSQASFAGDILPGQHTFVDASVSAGSHASTPLRDDVEESRSLRADTPSSGHHRQAQADLAYVTPPRTDEAHASYIDAHADVIGSDDASSSASESVEMPSSSAFVPRSSTKAKHTEGGAANQEGTVAAGLHADTGLPTQASDVTADSNNLSLGDGDRLATGSKLVTVASTAAAEQDDEQQPQATQLDDAAEGHANADAAMPATGSGDTTGAEAAAVRAGSRGTTRPPPRPAPMFQSPAIVHKASARSTNDSSVESGSVLSPSARVSIDPHALRVMSELDAARRLLAEAEARATAAATQINSSSAIAAPSPSRVAQLSESTFDGVTSSIAQRSHSVNIMEIAERYASPTHRTGSGGSSRNSTPEAARASAAAPVTPSTSSAVHQLASHLRSFADIEASLQQQARSLDRIRAMSRIDSSVHSAAPISMSNSAAVDLGIPSARLFSTSADSELENSNLLPQSRHSPVSQHSASKSIRSSPSSVPVASRTFSGQSSVQSPASTSAASGSISPSFHPSDTNTSARSAARADAAAAFVPAVRSAVLPPTPPSKPTSTPARTASGTAHTREQGLPSSPFSSSSSSSSYGGMPKITRESEALFHASESYRHTYPLNALPTVADIQSRMIAATAINNAAAAAAASSRMHTSATSTSAASFAAPSSPYRTIHVGSPTPSPGRAGATAGSTRFAQQSQGGGLGTGAGLAQSKSATSTPSRTNVSQQHAHGQHSFSASSTPNRASSTALRSHYAAVAETAAADAAVAASLGLSRAQNPYMHPQYAYHRVHVQAAGGYLASASSIRSPPRAQHVPSAAAASSPTRPPATAARPEASAPQPFSRPSVLASAVDRLSHPAGFSRFSNHNHEEGSAAGMRRVFAGPGAPSLSTSAAAVLSYGLPYDTYANAARQGHQQFGDSSADAGQLVSSLCRVLGIHPSAASSALIPRLQGLGRAAVSAASLDTFANGVCDKLSRSLLGIVDGRMAVTGTPIEQYQQHGQSLDLAHVGLEQAHVLLDAALAELSALRKLHYVVEIEAEEEEAAAAEGKGYEGVYAY